MFFFEKKNQKTFIRLGDGRRRHSDQMDKSLFASFSTEKEDSFFLPSSTTHNALSTNQDAPTWTSTSATTSAF